MSDLNDDKVAFVLPCIEKAGNKRLICPLAEEMKTLKNTAHSVEVSHHSLRTSLSFTVHVV